MNEVDFVRGVRRILLEVLDLLERRYPQIKGTSVHAQERDAARRDSLMSERRALMR